MSHTVQIASGYKQIVLPDGKTYDAGATAVLTDTQFAQISAHSLGTVVLDLGLTPDSLAGAQALTRTGVKAASYTAQAGELVPVDTTGGAVSIALVTSPPDKSRVVVKHILQTGTNAVTVTCGGSDVFNRTGGSASMSLALLNQSILLEYQASTHIWTIIAGDLFNASTMPYQFQPETYGAKGDNATNDQTAINAAITAGQAFASTHTYYFEVLFDPSKVYLVSGALIQGGATKGNSQIPCPVVDPTVGQEIVMVLRGSRDASAVAHWAQTVPQVSGAVIRSTLTTGTNDGTYGVASVIGSPTSPQGYGMAGNDATFTNLQVVIDGITVVTPSDPTVIAFDFNGVAGVNILSAAALANATPAGMVAPTHNWSMGIRMPAVNNHDNCNIVFMSVEGFYYAYTFNEHTTFHRILAVYCIHGIYAIGGSAHACITGLYASIELCQASLTIDPGTLCQVYIANLDVEDGTTPWNPSWHISDSGNQGRGYIGFTRNPPQGAPIILVGGAYLTIEYNRQQVGALGGSNPAVPATTVAFQNTFWKRAAVNITGGTVTVIAVDGVTTGLTSGTFIVPAGHTITLTYSVAPSWNWVLF